jgi:lantibiotic modifying enzyme
MSKEELSRRDALAAGITGVAGLAGSRFGLLSSAFKSGDKRYGAAAKQAGVWLRAQATEQGDTLRWIPTPGQEGKAVADLYSGMSGAVLFLAEAYHSFEDPALAKDLRMAAAGLRDLVGSEPFSAGLYTGQAGAAFALRHAYAFTKDKADLGAYHACIGRIREGATAVGKGVDWKAGSDIISGSAGTGLFLLWAHRQNKDEGLRELAEKAGDPLIELGIKDKGGLKWAPAADATRLMPNFSHGTAGVAYFLARLHRVTGEKRFLDAALAGATYLQAIAKTEGDECLIFHHEPGGEALYYLGWCHGPAGTARLFYALHQVTKDAKWLDWVHRAAHSIMVSGIPEKRTEGFWNNVGLCCGTAGVADFFLSLYGVTRRKQYLDFCNLVTLDLLNRATAEAGGLKWVHAENRVSPDKTFAQTGHMQGAAGIGLYLLRRDAFERGMKPVVVLPDSPFA